jgi:hypothetical protein
MSTLAQSGDCDNLNHRRADAPVAYCPQCGRCVNATARRPHTCDNATHAKARRERDAWCVHCGVSLSVSPADRR